MPALATAIRPTAEAWSSVVSGGVHSLCREDFQSTLVAAYARHRWIYDALLEHPDSTILRGRRPVVAGRLGGVKLVVKRIHHGGLFASIGRDAFLTPSRARAHVELADYLSSNGIATAPVVFTSWRRSRGFVRCEVGFEQIDGAVDADRYFFGPGAPPAEWEARAGDIGSLVARLHQIGFLHADLNLMNFLFTPDGETYILDLDKSALPGAPPSRRERSRNLDRLERSIRKQGKNHLSWLVESIIRQIRSSYQHALA
ncbi:MAG TPA: lipopolysaccharide kinase InaA family protein [Thermoanaerobaculia bacterium]|nr:lipopolysaccharide kinase InaA family protein [Thermoanaerobaculia bacterium]